MYIAHASAMLSPCNNYYIVMVKVLILYDVKQPTQLEYLQYKKLPHNLKVTHV